MAPIEDGPSKLQHLRALAAATAANISARNLAAQPAPPPPPLANGDGAAAVAAPPAPPAPPARVPPSHAAGVAAVAAAVGPPAGPPPQGPMLGLPPAPLPLPPAAAGEPSAKRRRFSDAGHPVTVGPPPLPAKLVALGFGLEEDAEALEQEVVQMPDELVGLFIGARGTGIRRIIQVTACEVIVGKLPDSGKRKVCLIGTARTRRLAKDYIDNFVAVAAAEERLGRNAVTMEIKESFVKDVLGPRGQTIQSIRNATGAKLDLDDDRKNSEGKSICRKLTLSGAEECIKKAREKVETIILDAHRRQGIYNPELELKFNERLAQAVVQPALAPPPPPLLPDGAPAPAPVPPPLMICGGTDLNAPQGPAGAAPPPPPRTVGGATLALAAVPAVPAPPPGPPPPTAADVVPVPAPPPPPPPVPEDCCEAFTATAASVTVLPMSIDQVKAWAVHYASDARCVDHYQQLRESGVRVGALLFGSLAAVSAFS